jgi:glycosyltransferase involved in cell wall biosynthesis
MNILILHTQIPFVSGGAEVLVDGLLAALRQRGHTADVVALPLAWNPTDRLLSSALAWRLLDLRRFNDRSVERVICTKYPTWAVEHPRKSLWLVHQHRQAYDLHGTSLSEFTPDDESQRIRKHVIEIDRVGISECQPRYAISRNVADRLAQFCGIQASPLYPPVPRPGLRPDAYEPFILSVARLDAAKRVDRIIDAFADVRPGLRLHLVGDGPDRLPLEQRVARLGLSDRVVFHGRVTDAVLLDLYNRCRAVYYAPIDEDYGYTTVEALSAGKPVVTAADSGGVLEFVRHEHGGLMTSLEAEPLAATIDRLADEEFAREVGRIGPTLTCGLTWDRVVDALVGES